MQAYLLFSISLCLAVGSLAERPHPCKSPPLVEGSMALTIFKEKTFGVEKFSYDAFEERVHIRLLLDQDNHTTYRDTLLLYKEGIAYKIFRHNQTCEKVHFKDPWKPMEIPRDAKFQSQVVIGSLSAPAEGLLVNNWSGTMAEPHDDYLLTFTEFGCLPVHAWWYNIERQSLLSLSFFDMVLGVEDPEVFNPPSFCDKAEPDNDGALTSFVDTLI